MILENKDLQGQLVLAERRVRMARLALLVAKDQLATSDQLDRLEKLVQQVQKERRDLLDLLEK